MRIPPSSPKYHHFGVRALIYEFEGLGEKQTFSAYQIIVHVFFCVLLLWHKMMLLGFIHIAASSYGLLTFIGE